MLYSKHLGVNISGGNFMQGREKRANPDARSEGLLTEQVGLETVVYDTESAEAHCLKPVAAAVFAYCDGNRSTAEISTLVSRDLGDDVTIDAVEDAVAQLYEHGLLKDTGESDVLTVSRRQMLRRTATVGGAAMAVPLIASAVAPIPAFATATCTPSSNTTAVGCNTDTDCSGGSAFSGTGTCGCKNFDAFGANCPPPPSGSTGICFFHTSSGACTPSCAAGVPPCKS
jgi:hypothetical protein